jgi:Cu/Ag efflux pump CusA
VVTVFAAYPGTTAEEVERQVTVPLEVTLAGMPRLQTMPSKSLAGLSGLHVRFEPGTDYHAARQEVINRLQLLQHLPAGVFPQVGLSPRGETLRYVLVTPRDAMDRPIYSLNDLRALQDWHLEREFLRLPGVAGVCSGGGTVKRYEIVPDPDRFRRYGITLEQLVDAVARSNANVATDVLVQGKVALNVRAVGLFGGGVDPLSAELLTSTDPQTASKLLRAAEQKRLREVRALVVAKVNDLPILVGDVVEGGRTAPGEVEGSQGVVVGSQPRLGRVACSGPGKYEDANAVQGLVQMRQGEELQLLRRVADRIRELNATAGKLLPGVRIDPYHISTGGTAALWVYGLFPLNTSPEQMAERARSVGQMLREFPEVERVVSQVGMSEKDDLQSSNQLQLFIGLKAGPDVPALPGRDRLRSREELVEAFNLLLLTKVPGVGWLTTTKSPEELGLLFPGAPAEHLLKIVGPDLDKLERLAGSVQGILRTVPGIECVAAYHSLGEPHLEFRIDPDKCQKGGVSGADVATVLQTALGGKSLTQMVEGEKSFDITMRWPKRLRESEAAILDLPLDITSNKVDASAPIQNTPRLRLRDLVSPVGKDGGTDPKGEFMRSGAAAIYREAGKRLLPVRFSVRGRPLVDVQAEAAKKIAPLLKAPYRIEWSD